MRKTRWAVLGSHRTSEPSSDVVKMCFPAERVRTIATSQTTCPASRTDAGCGVRATGRTVGGEGRGRDRLAVVPRVDVHEGAARAPEPRAAVHAPGQDEVALGVPCQAHDLGRAVERRRQRARVGLPDVDAPVQRPDRHELAVAAERHRAHRVAEPWWKGGGRENGRGKGADKRAREVEKKRARAGVSYASSCKRQHGSVCGSPL